MVRLNDIAENIRSILSYTAGMDEAAFQRDAKTRDAVERCLLRISEAARKLGDFAEERMVGHDWAGMRAIGNILRHLYDDVDPGIVWDIVSSDLPPLLRDIDLILAKG